MTDETRAALEQVLKVMMSTSYTERSWDMAHVYICHLLGVPSIYSNPDYPYAHDGLLKEALDALKGDE